MRKYEWIDGYDLDDAFEERAAILEYDAGYSRYNAEQLAAQMYGFDNKAELKAKVQDLKAFSESWANERLFS